MARRIPASRFDELVRAATAVFIARGYRLTQMADIAEAAGVAKGTLYRYVESKDALLEQCLWHADEPGMIPLPEGLPLPGRSPDELGAIVRAALSAGVQLPLLEQALGVERAVDPAQEMRAVFGELYDLMLHNRHRIKLLDRCMDHPALRNLWHQRGREDVRARMAQYLALRIRAGQARTVSNVRLAARLVIETLTTWAVHIHWDRAPEHFAPGEARENALTFLVCGLLSTAP